MEVSSVGLTGQGQEVQAKETAKQQPPPPPPAESDTVHLSDDAKALASRSVLDS